MDLSATMQAPCPADALFREVEDLSGYPSWLSIVTRAEPVPVGDGSGEGPTGGSGPAWMVELRGRIGPLARSKRLRMVRTRYEAGRHVRFEREEIDGRQHSPWVLEATVSSVGDDASELEMRLHYGGSFGGGLIERLLADEIEASRPRLADLVRAAGRRET